MLGEGATAKRLSTVGKIGLIRWLKVFGLNRWKVNKEFSCRLSYNGL